MASHLASLSLVVSLYSFTGVRIGQRPCHGLTAGLLIMSTGAASVLYSFTGVRIGQGPCHGLTAGLAITGGLFILFGISKYVKHSRGQVYSFFLLFFLAWKHKSYIYFLFLHNIVYLSFFHLTIVLFSKVYAFVSFRSLSKCWCGGCLQVCQPGSKWCSYTLRIWISFLWTDLDQFLTPLPPSCWLKKL